MAVRAKTAMLRIRVTPETKAAIAAEADRESVSESHVIRRALRDYLKGQVTK